MTSAYSCVEQFYGASTEKARDHLFMASRLWKFFKGKLCRVTTTDTVFGSLDFEDYILE